MSRGHYLAKRLLQTIPSIFVISIVSFLLLRVAPGDPARVIAGPRASEATVAKIQESMGLDKPLWVQYWRYVERVVHGDFGYNLTGSSKVSEIVRSGAVVTAWLTVAALILTLGLSVLFALLAVRRPDGLVDSLVRAFGVGGIALPSFWLAIMLIVFVALPTGLFPIGGWPTGIQPRLNAILLPALTLAVSLSPILVRSLRSSLLEVLGADYVLAAKAAGVGRWRLLSSYVLRNAVLPCIPLIAIIVGFLLGGSVVVETAFNLPGLGQILVQAVTNRDANLVQGITLVLGTLIVLVYLVADIAVSFVDPRVTLE